MTFPLASRGTKAVLGVVHLAPLPGTPFYRPGSLDEIVHAAVGSATRLDAGGADGCLLQTVDRVYSVQDSSDPARTAAMAIITSAVRDATAADFQVGVQIMRSAISASLAVAKVCEVEFVRVGALVGATLSTHGLVQPDPQSFMAYRRALDAFDVAVVADVSSMHFEWFGGERPVEEVAAAATLVGADAVCLGHPDEVRTHDALHAVRQRLVRVPIILAGHTNHQNARTMMRDADGVFVSTCLESATAGGSGIDAARVRDYVAEVRAAERDAAVAEVQ
jgi:membrane complex biogenesis BtpA family protein